jgi:hypothetical protein
MDPNQEPVICRVCGEQLGAETALACRDCGTPHHDDCWKFTGGCSVYGCGGTRAVPYSTAPPSDGALIVARDEVLLIDETTPTPAAYARRRDGFPTPAHLATLAYGNSITGLKLCGTGLLIWMGSLALGQAVPPLLFFTVAGSVLFLLAPLYWLAASVLSVLAISAGLAEGHIETRAVQACAVGAIVPALFCIYAGLSSFMLGCVALLFVAGFGFQMMRSSFFEKLDR